MEFFDCLFLWVCFQGLVTGGYFVLLRLIHSFFFVVTGASVNRVDPAHSLHLFRRGERRKIYIIKDGIWGNDRNVRNSTHRIQAFYYGFVPAHISTTYIQQSCMTRDVNELPIGWCHIISLGGRQPGVSGISRALSGCRPFSLGTNLLHEACLFPEEYYHFR